MTLAAVPSISGALRGARRLARRLLKDSPDSDNAGRDDAGLVAAFRAFQALLSADNAAAQDALGEMAEYHQSSQAEPYFLELLQAEDNRAARKRHGIYFTP